MCKVDGLLLSHIGKLTVIYYRRCVDLHATLEIVGHQTAIIAQLILSQLNCHSTVKGIKARLISKEETIQNIYYFCARLTSEMFHKNSWLIGTDPVSPRDLVTVILQECFQPKNVKSKNTRIAIRKGLYVFFLLQVYLIYSLNNFIYIFFNQ